MNYAGLFKWPLTYDDFGYAISDLNQDDVPELILMLRDYSVFAIFSMVDGKPKLLDSYYDRYKCAILDSGLLYTLGSSGDDNWEYAVRQLSPDGSEFLFVAQYGFSTGGEFELHDRQYYKVIGGERIVISEAEFMEFQKAYPTLSVEVAHEITRDSGINFVSLFG